jgi:hypothetical protein
LKFFERSEAKSAKRSFASIYLKFLLVAQSFASHFLLRCAIFEKFKKIFYCFFTAKEANKIKRKQRQIHPKTGIATNQSNRLRRWTFFLRGATRSETVRRKRAFKSADPK